MERRIRKGWSRNLLTVLVIVMVMSCGNPRETETIQPPDTFEKIRAYIQAWLSEMDRQQAIISSSYLKDKIMEDWGNQSKTYQIVSVRKPDDYHKAGHIANAINTYWIDIVSDKSISQLDSNKTLILYCYYGHGSMISYTILSLLGYECHSLNFGMMDWNLDALAKKAWDQKANYQVEVAGKRSEESYPLPLMVDNETDVKSIIKEQATKYLAGEGSPVILSSDVKAIVDDWERNNGRYQVVDVRSKKEFRIGHVPRSMNIPWGKIAEARNLKKIDPNRTVIVYSDNGQTGQMVTTVLSLLGYKAVNMLFGMMDWNKAYVDKSRQWDGAADYPIENENRSSAQGLGSH